METANKELVAYTQSVLETGFELLYNSLRSTLSQLENKNLDSDEFLARMEENLKDEIVMKNLVHQARTIIL